MAAARRSDRGDQLSERPTRCRALGRRVGARPWPGTASIRSSRQPLTEALRSGAPQNEAKHGGDFFGELYRDRDRLKQFLHAMTGLSMGAHKAIAAKFPWDTYDAFVDVGCAEGGLPVQLALTHKHLTGIGFDLAPSGRHFDEYVRSFGLERRLRFQPGDFFADPLPNADVIVLGHILHDWNLSEEQTLVGQGPRSLARRRSADRV
jgi:hypothetical protein